MRIPFLLLLILSIGYAEDQLFVVLSRDVDGLITEVSAPVDPNTLKFTIGSKARCSHTKGDGTFVDKVGANLTGTIVNAIDEAGVANFMVSVVMEVRDVEFKESDPSDDEKGKPTFLPTVSKTKLNTSLFMKIDENKLIAGFARDIDVTDNSGIKTSHKKAQNFFLRVQNLDIY